MMQSTILPVTLPSVLWRCWLGGRKGIRSVKTECSVLAWLSVWSDVQICIWPSWCHCHLLSLASLKSRLITARCCASAVLAMGLCPSVSVSLTSRCSTKTAKRRITQTTPHDTPKDSSFLMPKISAKFDRGHPLRGRQMQVGWVKIDDFRHISGYVSKTVKDRRIVSIKVK